MLRHSTQLAKFRTIVRIVLVLVFLFLIARLSWLADDSLITLRTALNLSHGWGPGFNATETVQSYTHPLWFLSWLVLGTLTGEWILTVLLLGLVCSVIAVCIALWIAPTLPAVITTFALLLLSSAFADFSTSGLENPMAFMWLGVLFLLLRGTSKDFRKVWILSALVGITAAAVLLTRLDLALLVAPGILWWLWRVRRDVRSLVALGAALIIPVVVWSLWAQVTYGSVLPNTFVAKTNLLIPQTELAIQGIRYIIFSIERDLISGLAIVVALLLSLVLNRGLATMWMLGVILYLCYVVSFGGDFMTGRFLAVPVYVSTLVIAASPLWIRRNSSASEHIPQREFVGAAIVAGLFILLVPVLSVTSLTPSALSGPSGERFKDVAGMNDQRGYWTTQFRHGWYWLMTIGTSPPTSGFLSVDEVADKEGRLDGMSDFVSTNTRLQPLREYAARWPSYSGQDKPRAVGVACGSLASGGLLTGPEVHWIDECALTDAYLAQQPYWSPPFRWVPGHYFRRVPEGYTFAILTGDAGLMADPGDAAELQEVWERIRR